MVSAPFADFTWRLARRMAAARGLPDNNETAVARVLDDLLTRAGEGPPDKATARVVARTRATRRSTPADAPVINLPSPAAGGDHAAAEVIPFGIFDADAEAERWL